MSIIIDKNKCVGCKKCNYICPGNLIYTKEDSTSEVLDRSKCWGCTSCMKECPFGAISLIAHEKGITNELCLKNEKDKIIWSVNDGDSTKLIIETYKKEANKY